MTTIALSEYLLDRLAQIGIEVGPNLPFPHVRPSTNPQSVFGVPGDFSLRTSLSPPPDQPFSQQRHRIHRACLFADRRPRSCSSLI